MECSNARRVERQNRSSRKVAQLPISINGEPGVTRDISVSGMFIVQGRQQEIGSHIEFTVQVDTPMGKIELCCKGEVVRVEENIGSNDRIGIGIEISHQFGRQTMFDKLPDASAGTTAPSARAASLLSINRNKAGASGHRRDVEGYDPGLPRTTILNQESRECVLCGHFVDSFPVRVEDQLHYNVFGGCVRPGFEKIVKLPHDDCVFWQQSRFNAKKPRN